MQVSSSPVSPKSVIAQPASQSSATNATDTASEPPPLYRPDSFSSSGEALAPPPGLDCLLNGLTEAYTAPPLSLGEANCRMANGIESGRLDLPETRELAQQLRDVAYASASSDPRARFAMDPASAQTFNDLYSRSSETVQESWSDLEVPELIDALAFDQRAELGRGVLDQGNGISMLDRDPVRAYLRTQWREDYPSENPPTPERPRIAGLSAPEVDTAVDTYAEHFAEIDSDGDGTISRSESRVLLQNPQNYGFSSDAAVQLYLHAGQLAVSPGADGESVTLADLQADPSLTQNVRQAMMNGSSFARPDSPQEDVLFGNEGTPDPLSVRQGQEGDCWLLSAMSLLSPEEIQRLISPTEEGKIRVTFPGREPVDLEPLTEAERQVYSTANGDWSAYLEKGAAETYQHQGRDINGGWGSDAIELLTGNRTGNFSLVETAASPQGREELSQFLDDAISSGRIVTAGTNPSDYNGQTSLPSGNNHAYAVLDFDATEGIVTIRNPWGQDEFADRDGDNDGVFTMTLDQLMTNFSRIDHEVS